MLCRLKPSIGHDPVADIDRDPEGQPSTAGQECKRGHTVPCTNDAEEKLCRALVHHVLEFHTARAEMRDKVELICTCIQEDSSTEVTAYTVDVVWNRSDGQYEADVQRQVPDAVLDLWKVQHRHWIGMGRDLILC